MLKELKELKDAINDVNKAGNDYDKRYFAQHNLSRWFVIYQLNHNALCVGGILESLTIVDKVTCLQIGTGKMYNDNKNFVNTLQADKDWYFCAKRLTEKYGCVHTILETIEKFYDIKFFKTVATQMIVAKEGTYNNSNNLKEGIMLKLEPYAQIYTYNIFYAYELNIELLDKSIEGKQGGFLLRTNKFLRKDELIDLVLEKYTKYKIVNVGDLLKDKKVFVY